MIISLDRRSCQDDHSELVLQMVLLVGISLRDLLLGLERGLVHGRDDRTWIRLRHCRPEQLGDAPVKRLFPLVILIKTHHSSPHLIT